MCGIKQYYSIKQTKLKSLYFNRTIQHQNITRGKESTQENILEIRSPFDYTCPRIKMKNLTKSKIISKYGAV